MIGAIQLHVAGKVFHLALSDDPDATVEGAARDFAELLSGSAWARFELTDGSQLCMPKQLLEQAYVIVSPKREPLP